MELIYKIVMGALSILITFGLAVFVHEFGHMFFAIIRGVGVESFAIGMGPKITSWKWHNIEFSLRWFPVGGFVKLGQPRAEAEPAPDAAQSQAEAPAGTDTPVAVTGPAGEKDLAESSYDDMMALAGKGLLTKLLVFGGGVFMNYMAAMAAMALFLALPHEMERIPLDIETVKAGSALEQAGMRAGDEIAGVNGRPVQYLHQLEEALEEAVDREAKTSGLPELEIKLSLTFDVARAGGPAKVALPPADLKMLAEYLTGDIELRCPPVIGSVIPTMPAHKAGIEPGDRIVAVDGQPVATFLQMATRIRAGLGKEIVFEADRDGQRLTFKLAPKESIENPGQGMIGIAPQRSQTEIEPGLPPTEAVASAPIATWRKLKWLWNEQIEFFRKVTSFRQVADNVGGPVMIAAMTVKASEKGFDYAVNWFIMLNLLLLIFNLLPLPVLDGGFILLSLIEAVIRRPVPARILAPIYTVFVVLFIGLMVVISLWDVKRWFF